MKIRNGFVSNSSTTSFCLYGIYIEEEELAKRLQIEIGTDDIDFHGELEDDIIEVFSEPYDSGYYVGVALSKIKDDETGAQFKERIRKALDQKMDITELEFDIMQDAWYNG